MGAPLRLLLVEDSPDDAALLLRELRRGGYEPEWERVETAQAMEAALRRQEWDIVISDFSMPGFSGPAALALLRKSGLDLPIIMISGSVDEEAGVKAMRQGASDYLAKDNFTRLLPALERELREARVRRAHRSAEEALRRQDLILKAVGSAAQLLLRAASWTDVVPEVLATLGRAGGASRAYLFERLTDRDGAAVVRQRHEWVAEDVEPHIDDPRLQWLRLADAGFGSWEERLQRGDAVHGVVRELPGPQREFLSAQGILSLAVVPVFSGADWWGFIGYDDCASERKWSGAELDALRAAADTLGTAIQRSRVEEQVQRQVRRLAALRSINLAITASMDLGVTLEVLLDQVTAQLRVDAAAVLLFHPQSYRLEFAAGRGFRTGSFQQISLHLGDGHAGRAALAREVVSVPDLARDPGVRARSVAEEGFVAYYGSPLVAKGEVKGVLELFHRAPFEIDGEWVEFLRAIAAQAALALDNASLFDDLQRSNVELVLAYDTTLAGWSKALDLRDKETEGHTLRVTDLTVSLARAMDLGEGELVHVRRGALLHDIGKMGVPDSILFKAGPLTDEEWKVMRLHPVHAYELLAPISYLRPAIDIPYCHHEWWDGSGYPRALRGEAIPLAARIFAIVDVWDALRSDRPYRPAWPKEKVCDHIRRRSGSHFDPAVTEIFLAELQPDGESPPPDFSPAPAAARASAAAARSRAAAALASTPRAGTLASIPTAGTLASTPTAGAGELQPLGLRRSVEPAPRARVPFARTGSAHPTNGWSSPKSS